MHNYHYRLQPLRIKPKASRAELSLLCPLSYNYPAATQHSQYNYTIIIIELEKQTTETMHDEGDGQGN